MAVLTHYILTIEHVCRTVRTARADTKSIQSCHRSTAIVECLPRFKTWSGLLPNRPRRSRLLSNALFATIAAAAGITAVATAAAVTAAAATAIEIRTAAAAMAETIQIEGRYCPRSGRDRHRKAVTLLVASESHRIGIFEPARFSPSRPAGYAALEALAAHSSRSALGSWRVRVTSDRRLYKRGPNWSRGEQRACCRRER